MARLRRGRLLRVLDDAHPPRRPEPDRGLHRDVDAVSERGVGGRVHLLDPDVEVDDVVAVARGRRQRRHVALLGVGERRVDRHLDTADEARAAARRRGDPQVVLGRHALDRERVVPLRDTRAQVAGEDLADGTRDQVGEQVEVAVEQRDTLLHVEPDVALLAASAKLVERISRKVSHASLLDASTRSRPRMRPRRRLRPRCRR